MTLPLLGAHIFFGSIALLAGVAALSVRKGSSPHRVAGNVFFVAMLGMAASGVYLAYTIPAMLSMAAGVLTGYQVATAWMTVKRKPGEIGRFEWVAMIFALAAAAGCIGFGLQVARGELTEFAAGEPIPPGTYFFYGGVALFSAALDLSVILRGGLQGAQRIARHLWRMGFALFTAAASFFLGQTHIFPAIIRETPFLLEAPVLAVVILTVFWLSRVLFTGWRRTARP